ncbi:YgaP family membrane protein [Sutcliffiella rhizosphaerae]|uniref:Inner membrane protein YgaP-like transmembrane domain-containing protein n=1 Tax=Sutcliffiella rhizosphaerae TaxID=2880967 RepID=A0ABN8ABP9_9BACI|nr:DUF2892 domain-containing protein [Sutcliffiella rhizosphaerae]CAG9621351.1 hypothetical protein BACCIP111883_02123 [Sutcliffiella rhizosphaerae]
MKIRPNIGLINALIRITAGFATLAWITSKMVRRPHRDSYKVVALLAGMKIAEGLLRYCPLTAGFERLQDYRNEHNDANNHYDFNFDDFETDGDAEGEGTESYNPS